MNENMLPHYNSWMVNLRSKAKYVKDVGCIFMVWMVLGMMLSTSATVTAYCIFGIPSIILCGVFTTAMILLVPVDPKLIHDVVQRALQKETQCGVPDEYKSSKWWVYIYYIVCSKLNGVWRFYARLATGGVIMYTSYVVYGWLELTTIQQLFIVPVYMPLVSFIWILWLCRRADKVADLKYII